MKYVVLPLVSEGQSKSDGKLFGVFKRYQVEGHTSVDLESCAGLDDPPLRETQKVFRCMKVCESRAEAESHAGMLSARISARGVVQPKWVEPKSV